MASLKEAITHAAERLQMGPHPARARADAELLLLQLLGRNRAWRIAHECDPLEESESRNFSLRIDRRLAGEPIQYIIGEAEFYGLPFQVTPAVLIPRPETEHLVEKVLQLAASVPKPLRLVDVGTGSGAIPIALAVNLPTAEITSIDISPDALALAAQNAEHNLVKEKIRLLQGDLLEPVAQEYFDFVVSNPPYIPLSDRAGMDVEVREHEPELALFAGEDGLAIYRRLIPQAFVVLKSGGWLLLEIGFGQQTAIEELLRSAGFSRIAFIDDLQGIARVACGQRSIA